MASSQPRRKTFNLSGTLSDLRLARSKQGLKILTATLHRDAKPAQKLVAFGTNADQVTAQFAEGDRTRVFGYFRKSEVVDPNTGEIREDDSFVVLRADEPGGKRGGTLSADEAYARLQQAQAIYEIDPGSHAAQRALESARRDLDRVAA